MSFFRSEPAALSEDVERTGILLCNLGTPETPTAVAVRRYLAEFLSDRRVVELPRVLWLPLLHGLILRLRPAKVAEKYKSVWMETGSPLLVWSDRQAALLRGYLGERGHDVDVRLAMRYGQPSISSQLDALKSGGCTRILVVPLYPQYSGSITASVVDAVGQWAGKTRFVPELRFIGSFHDDEGYIKALAARVREHWRDHGRPDKLVLSFHGIPQAMVDRGDPYYRECAVTAECLAYELGLGKNQWQMTFQSRFGPAKWVGPPTQKTLQELGKAGTLRVDVICPGFVSDCLETLEEVAMECRDDFISAGGREFHHIACLNDHPAWIEALTALTERHMQGWSIPATGSQAASVDHQEPVGA